MIYFILVSAVYRQFVCSVGGSIGIRHSVIILKTFFRRLCLLAMSDNPTENHRNLVCVVSVLSVPLTRQV